jgi:biopolymer transport protein TolR
MAGKLSSADAEIISDINVTPLVDIMLVLLIIFMLTATVIAKRAIEVELPEAATGDGVPPTTVGITLDRDGALYLNGAAIDEAALRIELARASAADAKAQAVIAADKAVSHGQVVRVIDLVRQEGITKFALNIEPEARPGATEIEP